MSGTGSPSCCCVTGSCIRAGRPALAPAHEAWLRRQRFDSSPAQAGDEEAYDTVAQVYEWTINFDIDANGDDFGEATLALKFGPSAWFANEHDVNWKHTVDPAPADYSHVFLTRSSLREVRQSVATVHEVLDGLEPMDRRRRDAIKRLMSDS